MIARWVDVEAVVKVVVVRAPIDKHWFATGCEISLTGVDVRREGPSERFGSLMQVYKDGGCPKCCG